MQRRDFFKLSSLGVGGLVASRLALAKSALPGPVSDIYFTQESPGRWKEKVAGHLPSIGVERNGGKLTVKVVTSHEMKGYEHYIVKHVLLDKNYQFIDEHLFNPEKELIPASSFVLENYSGVIYALSMCNKHDVWLNSAEI